MSKQTHQINLSRMWRALDNDSTERLGTPIDVDPARSNRWIDLTQFSVRESDRSIQLIRNFNCPTNLNADSRCDLVFENLPVETICQLNGQRLGTIDNPTCRFEVRQYLQATNRILIELPLMNGFATHSGLAARLELM